MYGGTKSRGFMSVTVANLRVISKKTILKLVVFYTNGQKGTRYSIGGKKY